MSAEADDKKTALYGQHQSLGAKIIPFSGWLMPVSYEGVVAEHKKVRSDCGVFDVSHMGEISVRGPGAAAFLQHLTINDINRLTQPGMGQYTAMLNPAGGVIDDLIIYRLGDDDYLLCVNAANIQKDFNWIRENRPEGEVLITNESDFWSQIAVQGPNSARVLGSLLSAADRETFNHLEYMQIMPVEREGQRLWLARTGYTGEHGYELYLPDDLAVGVWQALLEGGAAPIGLGARDTLRLEACYLLYGNDMNDSVTPLEAGIGWVVRWDCGPFIGSGILQGQKADGAPRKMVAFTMIDKGIARQHMTVYAGEKPIGEVTSGSFLPSLNQAAGLALVENSSVKPGDTIGVDIRGKRKLAKVVKRPLYSAKVK